ncbi:hypothetical protein METBIDRAFT_13738 [Metschnikowia bicuspidata var. bicuspidata NRRL YB-4993]|uniref:Uncharacterized protein n=1 Tax=Metschnikowia bicuspidata var. bicuspidata NRRL YB-4993 TaxID=869754 RepID=A0A1A0H4L1_9ASCO|nr:hypothetical protein METBIDRAFT_13738 [Metschnikowia bicuspidata var. bicuspidata NRRL YB-4993]OBA18976.1 hypothetical protein METBIDRAFT_13738 [Metschnikowia bicuspidata var. bicuspidata NRRL YB-4993]
MGNSNHKPTGTKSTKLGKSSSASRTVPPKASVLKSKLKLRSKRTKAQIEKLNQDESTIASIHAALLARGQVPKEVKILDAQSLREGMLKDQQTKLQSEKAEKDLASQLELITGMAL